MKGAISHREEENKLAGDTYSRAGYYLDRGNLSLAIEELDKGLTGKPHPAIAEWLNSAKERERLEFAVDVARTESYRVISNALPK